MSSDNNRAFVSNLYYIAATGSGYTRSAGSSVCTLSGALTKLNIRNGQLVQQPVENNPNCVAVSVTAIHPDTSANNQAELERLARIPLILVAELSNGERRCLGSIDRPVEISVSVSGNPLAINIAIHRMEFGFLPSV